VISKTNTTILIIDDASESLNVLSDLLHLIYRVLAATSGEGGPLFFSPH